MKLTFVLANHLAPGRETPRRRTVTIPLTLDQTIALGIRQTGVRSNEIIHEEVETVIVEDEPHG